LEQGYWRLHLTLDSAHACHDIDSSYKPFHVFQHIQTYLARFSPRSICIEAGRNKSEFSCGALV
jgi:hypothetical protein